jgi:hypothetical protein
MDIKKLLTFIAGGPTKRRGDVAQVGNYASQIDTAGVDPAMRRTMGIRDSSVAPAVAARDTSLDAIARRAGRRVPPTRSTR